MPHLNETHARLLIIGSEVINGFIADTNSQFISSQLFQSGIPLKEIRVIPDDKKSITGVLKEWVKTGDLIITTGGLGPTDDDLTVDILCKLMEVNAVFSKKSMVRVRKVIERYKTSGSEFMQASFEQRLYRQCRIPENATALPNPAGLAPGIFIPEYRIISLPGFPLEIRGIWPYAEKKIRENLKSHFLSAKFNIWGVIEGMIYESIKFPEEITVGNHSLPWGNQLFIKTAPENKENFLKISSKIKKKFSPYILENPILAWIDYLKKNKLTFGTVESCTGGFAAKLLTDIPGVSDIFLGSVVSYDNSIKTRMIGVKEITLETWGAVSRETAREMAAGGCRKLGSDIAISITGIAGPSGGTKEKPAGTVYYGIFDKKQNVSYTGYAYFPLGRERFRNAAVHFIFLALYQRYVYYGDENKWINSEAGKNFMMGNNVDL
ncbi:MAG: nicotinamide-nucleotide amidohydrolase family protein [Spirochaetia bacterium]|nr:nicotinamide-nucleotide amidohydrolase family protein [Spirochaetia bacterium]